MKKVLIIILNFISFQLCLAQQTNFSKIYFDTYHDVSAEALVKSFDGGFVIGGLHYYSSSLIKFDSLGTMVWAKKFGAFLNENVNAVIATSDSCFVMAGRIEGVQIGYCDFQLTKFNQSGNLIWSKVVHRLDMQELFSLAETFDGGFVACGYEIDNPFALRLLVTKFDSNGEIEWIKNYSSEFFHCLGQSIKQTPDSGFVVAGYTDNSIEGNGLLVKLSQNGDVEWVNEYSHSSHIGLCGRDLVITNDGIISLYAGDGILSLLKTDFSGNDFWNVTFSGFPTTGFTFGNVVAQKLILLTNGNLLMASADRGMAGFSSVLCVDTTGSLNWCRNIENSVHAVEEASDHGYYLLGNGPVIGPGTSPFYYRHVGIIKTDSLGNSNICTSINSSISSVFGIISKSIDSLKVSSISINSTDLSPVVSNFVLGERISCVDFVSGAEEFVQNSMEAFPNPSSTEVRIRIPESGGKCSLEIIDILGNLVFEKNNIESNGQYIDIEHNFSSGLYTIIISSETKRSVKKLVVK